MRKRAGLPILAACLLAAGCGGMTPRPAARPDAAEAEDLKARVVELQRKAAMSEVEIARLSQRIADLEAGGSGRPRTSPPSSPSSSRLAPSTGSRTRETREPREITELPEPVSGLDSPARREPTPPTGGSRTSPSIGREVVQDVEESDLDLPPAPAPRPSTPAPRVTPQVTAKPAPPSTRPPATSPRPAAPEPSSGEPVAAQALYDRGYTLYHQGRFADAEASFQRFLQADPSGELADNAQYWIGECRYGRNDLRGALAAFQETVARYPAGNKVPDALLKTAQALEGLGDTAKARTAYDEVIRKFPESTAAAAAAERKAKLR